MKLFLKRLLLLLTAIILYLVIMPIAIIYILIKLIIKKQYNQILLTFSNIFRSHAVGINQTGNSSFHDFFNDILIKDDTIHPFGDIDETISSVLGKNKLKNNLTIFGKIIDFILSIFEENHTIKAIDKQ